MTKSNIQNLHPTWIKLGAESTIPIYDKILNEIILLFETDTIPKKEDLRDIVKTYAGLKNTNTVRYYASAYLRYIMKNKFDVSLKLKVFKYLKGYDKVIQ